MTGSEMSSKTVSKADDFERVGNFVVADGKLMVIEYSDLPDELGVARNADGSRKFDAGSIAIHVLSRRFVERLTADPDAFALPWHRADKKVAHVDERGRRVAADKPNAVKLETFIFDAIPLANGAMVLQTVRAEEFSPVKNASGADSAETSRRDMVRRRPHGWSGAATTFRDARTANRTRRSRSVRCSRWTRRICGKCCHRSTIARGQSVCLDWDQAPTGSSMCASR